MKKATRVSIQNALQPYLLSGPNGQFILQENLDEIMGMVMTEFSGIYCVTYENKAGELVFSVISAAKTKTSFVELFIR